MLQQMKRLDRYRAEVLVLGQRAVSGARKGKQGILQVAELSMILNSTAADGLVNYMRSCVVSSP